MSPHGSWLAVLAGALAVGTLACSSRPAPPPAAPPPVALAPAPPPALPGHLSRTEVDRVLVTQGPPWVLRRVQAEEVLRSDGKFIGWRMVGLPSEWADIDLRPGDIVTKVNGLALETPDDAWEAWKSVAKAVDVRITLTRDGAARTLVLPIDGPPLLETANALGHDPGPSRPAPPPEARGKSLGGVVIDSDQDTY